MRSLREVAFNGWFGPIGIAAIFYAVELQHQPAVQLADRIWHIVSLVVFASILLHGITATPLTLAFGRVRMAGGGAGAEETRDRGKTPAQAGKTRSR